MSDKHHDKSPGHSQETAASDRLRHDDHQADSKAGEKHAVIVSSQFFETWTTVLTSSKKLNPLYKPEPGLVGPGCYKVDMLHDKPAKNK